MDMISKQLPSVLRESNYRLFLSQLNERVISLFPNNPSIKPIHFTAEDINDQGIVFNIKLLQLL